MAWFSLTIFFYLAATPHASLAFPPLVLRDFTNYKNLINAFGRTKSLIRLEMDPCAYWCFLREMPPAKLGVIYAGLPTSTASIERVWSACGYLHDHGQRSTGEHFLAECHARWNIMALTNNYTGEPDLPMFPDVFDHPETVGEKLAHYHGGGAQMVTFFFVPCSPHFEFDIPSEEICVSPSPCADLSKRCW